MTEIVFDQVTKVYPDGTRAVSEVDLRIPDGSLVVLVGPSGCGKTTLLRMVAGLETITEGEIRIGDEVVNDLEPKERDIAMVFQNYALYPHMSAFDNIGFSLKMRRTPKDEIRRKVTAIARTLGLTEYLEKKPKHLSGGQRQRVAMGRAIVRQPQAFLMDEPLSNLDAKLRVQMRAEIGRLQRDLAVTTIYVTHDQTEAMTLGDLVAVMKLGVIQQLASPQTLYRHPVNLFVAGFIGSPAMNFASGRLEPAGDGLTITFGDVTLTLDQGALAARPAIGAYAGREVIVGIRPEDMEDATLVDAALAEHVIRTVVDLREEMGAKSYVYFSPGRQAMETESIRRHTEDLITTEVETEPGDEALPRPSLFVARMDPRSGVREGGTAEVFVNTSAMHFFDPETGTAIYDQASEELERSVNAAVDGATR